MDVLENFGSLPGNNISEIDKFLNEICFLKFGKKLNDYEKITILKESYPVKFDKSKKNDSILIIKNNFLYEYFNV